MVIYYGNNSKLIYPVSMRSFTGNIFSFDQKGMVVVGLVSYILICPKHICLAPLCMLVLITSCLQIWSCISNAKPTRNVPYKILYTQIHTQSVNRPYSSTENAYIQNKPFIKLMGRLQSG